MSITVVDITNSSLDLVLGGKKYFWSEVLVAN